MKKLIILFFLFLSFSCKTFKDEIKENGTYETAIENAIIDFSNTSNLFKKDNTFTVSFEETKEGYLGVSILGTVNKVYYFTNSNENFLPNKCIEYNGKLFYWNNKRLPQDEKVINKLYKYKILDTIPSFGYAENIHDDRKKGIDYFFCKNNFLKYKKVKTNIGLGYYKAPVLKCD